MNYDFTLNFACSALKCSEAQVRVLRFYFNLLIYPFIITNDDNNMLMNSENFHFQSQKRLKHTHFVCFGIQKYIRLN